MALLFMFQRLFPACLVEDGSDFRISELFIDFGTCQSYELMAEVVDPGLIGRAVENVLAAPVIGLDRKRRGLLVEGDLVVVYGDLEVLAGNPLVHDDSCKGVYRIAGIEDIVHKKNLVT